MRTSPRAVVHRAVRQAATLVLLVAAPLSARAANGVVELGVVRVSETSIFSPGARLSLDRPAIERTGATSVGDLLAFVPSAKVQFNSRGEQVFALRGSDQRQVALTLDGAPLTSAWDGQLDLGLIPASAIEQVRVTRGPGTLFQAPNAIAGAVNLASRRPAQRQLSTTSFLAVDRDRRRVEAFAGFANDSDAVAISASWLDSDGHRPGGENNRLVGSEAHTQSALATWQLTFSAGTSMAFTLLLADTEKGVIPERDAAGARFWRYPVSDKALLVWSGTHAATSKAVEWLLYANHARSQIDQYRDATFATLTNTEDGKDADAGGRVRSSLDISPGQRATIGMAWSTSRHLFRERATSAARFPFTQVLSMVAAEWEGTRRALSWRAGLGIERADTPDTGPFSVVRSQRAVASSVGAAWQHSNALRFEASFGRKTRFPSLRESFNGALGRFEPNPSLRPETANTAAAGMIHDGGRLTWEAWVFGTDLRDGIVRQSLPADRFTRINHVASRIRGVEFAIAGAPFKPLQVRLKGTLLTARGRNPARHFADRVEYRPGINLQLESQLQLRPRLALLAYVRGNGDEHGLKAGESVIQRLPDHVLLDVALTYQLAPNRVGHVAWTVRGENFTDTFYLPQWGIPGPGRRVVLELRWSR